MAEILLYANMRFTKNILFYSIQKWYGNSLNFVYSSPSNKIEMKILQHLLTGFSDSAPYELNVNHTILRVYEMKSLIDAPVTDDVCETKIDMAQRFL